MIHGAHEERFITSNKQITELEKWQTRNPSKDGSKEEEDVTTEDSSSDHFDDSDQ
jgi:hypothetical protein